MTGENYPSAILSHLHRADGSVTFSQNGYTIIGAVNGPIEVIRRDELPEEAALDVIVRPAAGSGGTRERHLETILHATLRQIILIQDFPRTAIQVTLQVTEMPDGNPGLRVGQTDSVLPILPALLQAAALALLSASIPMAIALTSVLLAAKENGDSNEVVRNPSPKEVRNADSVHVLAFSSQGDLLVVESEGSFSMEEWDEIYETARIYCEDEKMLESCSMDEGLEGKTGGMLSFVRTSLQNKIEKELDWKLQNG